MKRYKFEAAERHYQQGLYDTSISTLKELLAECPDEAIYHGLLAANLLAKGRLHAAGHELNIALRLDSSISFLHLLMARLNVLRNKPKAALECCDEALRLDSEDTDALLTKAEIFHTLDKRAVSLACIEEAAILEPVSRRVRIAFGKYHLASGSLKEAREYAREALAADAQDEAANLLMGEIQLASGNIEEAEYHAKFVILQNPNNHSALELFSNIKMRRNLLFGLWWRFNNKIASLSNLKGALVLVAGYLFFTLLARIVLDLGHTRSSIVISLSWLALVVYTWVGVPYYKKVLKRELDTFSFNPNF